MKNLPSILFAGALALGASASHGCKWTDFDDIQDTTWAVSLQKPSAVSTTGDWGYGLVSSRGGKPFLAIGRNDASVAAMSFNANGGEVVANTVSNPSKIIGPQVNIGGHPLIAMTPDGANAAVLAGSTAQVWKLDHFEPVSLTGSTPNAIAISADASKVYFGTDTGTALNGSTECPGATGKKVIALLGQGPQSVLAWYADGSVELFTAMPACTKTTRPSIGATGGIGEGMIVEVDNGAKHAIMAQLGTNGSIFVVDLATGTLLSTTPAPGLSALAATTMTTKTGVKEVVVAGFKDTIVEGVANAGEAKLYFFESGALSEQGTMHDASPQNDQNFGRTVATTELEGKPVILIGADNEVFAYFETSFYDNSRAK
jgi:hypothetical protein